MGIIENIFLVIYKKILIIYAFIMGQTNSSSIEPVNSFIVTENDIDIITLSKEEIDKENILNFLKHHIIYTDDKFYPMYFFNEPLIIRFKYQNEVYKICLNKLENERKEHLQIIRGPKILSAFIKNGNDEEYITDEIIELHGPNRNFFSHIPDVESDISIILKKYKGNLYTFDMMGKHVIYDLVDSSKIII